MLRNKFFIIASLSLVFLFASCEKTLNEDPQSIIAPDAFFKTADQCRQATNGVYSHLPGIFNQTGLWSVTMAGTDLFMNQGGKIGSTRLNSSHVKISYAVFCLKKKIKQIYLL